MTILQPGKLYTLTAKHKEQFGVAWKDGCWTVLARSGPSVNVHMDTVMMFESWAPDQNREEVVAWFLIGDQVISTSLEQDEIEGTLERVGK